MTSPRLARHSLKTRITLFTLAIFTIGIWALMCYASWMLREHVQHLLSEQQFSTVATLAAQVNAELDSMLQRMLLAAIFLTLLAGGLTWWMIRRQLSPMLATVKVLAALSQSTRPPQPLRVASQDEIGELIAGFNHLLDTEQQREAMLRQILDTSSVAIFLVDMEGRITQANMRMAEMFGCSLDALLGNEYVALVHPAERESGRQHMLALLASAVPSVDLDRLYWRADRTEFWGHLTSRRFYGASGEERGLVGVIADVTDRKRAELALRNSEARYRSFVADLPIGIVVTQDGLIKYVNQTTVEMIGYPENELVGRPFLPLVAEADRQRLMDLHRRRMSGEDSERSYVVGMVRKDGEVRLWQGYVNTVDWDGHPSGLGSFIDITERKVAEDEIQQLAFYDPLTRLPNRRLLLDRLGQALASSARSGRIGALLFIDLDNFKTLNDTLGHDKGDLLLQQVAERLATCVREGDTVARLGGDEFVVMLEDLSGNSEEAATQTETVGEKIFAMFHQPYLLTGHNHHSTPSVGVTLFRGHQSSIEELLKQADLAMYQAKTAGRNALRFFDPAMQATVTDRAVLEVELREAVRQQQFMLCYQPQVVDAGRLTGAEALVRWRHPERGLVLPADFIALAEDTGLILPLGLWVLETACAQLVKWAAQPNTAHLIIAVNVSANQFRQADFVDQVLAVLTKTGANPQRLKLELTESLLVSNVDDLTTKMKLLTAKGVGFSLDDFGTGYSSLSYLKRLPLDQLKIDRSFVRDILIDPNDAAIAKMVIVLAESLGLSVIAEGVETEAQRDLLARQGCHAYQGDLFSRPLPVEEFEAFVQRG